LRVNSTRDSPEREGKDIEKRKRLSRVKEGLRFGQSPSKKKCFTLDQVDWDRIGYHGEKSGNFRSDGQNSRKRRER